MHNPVPFRTSGAAMVIIEPAELENGRVLQQAETIARKCNWPLTLFCRVDAQPSTELYHRFETRLTELNAELPAASGCLHHGADPIGAAIEHAADHECSIIFKRTEQRATSLRDSVDRRLLREAETPVWFVKTDAPAIDTVVAAVGTAGQEQTHQFFDHGAYLTLDAAQSAASQLQADMVAVHVVEGNEQLPDYKLSGGATLIHFPPAAELSDGAVQNARNSAHSSQLKAFQNHFDLHQDDLVVRPGNIDDVVPNVTEATGGDLLVLSARLRDEAPARYEPVAELLVDESPCDVLVVKNPAEPSREPATRAAATRSF